MCTLTDIVPFYATECIVGFLGWRILLQYQIFCGYNMNEPHSDQFGIAIIQISLALDFNLVLLWFTKVKHTFRA